MKIGYARISTASQSVDGQVEQLRSAGCSQIVEETASGAASDRPALRKLINSLNRGDVIVVVRLDRLARSTIDLLTMLKSVADHGASFLSLQENWADTTTAAGRLILTVIGGLAEFERELIKSRTSEGRERAKARGVRMGRKHKLTPHQQAEVRKRKAEGHSVRELGRSYNVSANTISRIK
ncbi:DNA invertase Pin-like site-specific DNA recombinase [Nitrobacteraceae bacterium AZCC 2161]